MNTAVAFEPSNLSSEPATGHDSIALLFASLHARDIFPRQCPASGLIPATVFEISPADWGHLAEAALGHVFRWVAGWALEHQNTFKLYVCLEKKNQFLLFRTQVESSFPALSSHTPWFPGAARSERHTHDILGIEWIDHPDRRRWTRHQAWPADAFPLRTAFPQSGLFPMHPTLPDCHYPFYKANGLGVYEIPVGPVHAGIIEPGHFRFLAVGEQVLHLEERLGYVHKGIEKIAVGRDPTGLARLAARVSGDTTVAHTWAACMAMERAAGVDIPPRASILRGIFAERERIANHLGDCGALCNDVAFTFGYYQLTRIKEQWIRNNRLWFGHRFLMDKIIPGGVICDISPKIMMNMVEEANQLKKELVELRPIFDDNVSLQDRFQGAGELSEATARSLGCLGYVARASGLSGDLRRDSPYPPYDHIEVKTVCYQNGDVRARFDVRYDEIYTSLDIIRQLLEQIREGDIHSEWICPLEGAEGLGLIEGWRGEILAYIRFRGENKIDRYYPRDPSVFNWLALEQLIHGNIVPDFPLCNKSVNGSYSGQDL